MRTMLQPARLLLRDSRLRRLQHMAPPCACTCAHVHVHVHGHVHVHVSCTYTLSIRVRVCKHVMCTCACSCHVAVHVVSPPRSFSAAAACVRPCHRSVSNGGHYRDCGNQAFNLLFSNLASALRFDGHASRPFQCSRMLRNGNTLFT